MKVTHAMIVIRSQDKNVYLKNVFLISEPKHYVVGTQKNRLNETVLLRHPKHMFKITDKKIIVILR